ncbi:hypothetical protein GX50_00827 [[Emmonsia] crescens]|uniref:Uncharacterized protein n=1 Tax=[Emmonsia] crescens TaxID=73230 RepID=A0A2B7ZTK2_9EURO|nr:hypothetical protein GX50_00827 [Emmonsia crescens]
MAGRIRLSKRKRTKRADFFQPGYEYFRQDNKVVRDTSYNKTLDSNPLCTIKFRYRSREALKELGDIPAPGSLTVRVKETHEEECLRGERLNMFLHNPYEMPNLNRGAERSPMGMGATTGTLPLHIKPPEARNSSGGVTPSNNCPDQYLPDN